MGKTRRHASNWMETRFKLGDPMCPDEVHFFDGRYQAKMRNKNRSYMHEKLDPRSMKTLHWAEYGKWFKAKAKRTARHKAKILIKIEAHIIMQEVWDDYWAIMWSMDEDDWYENHPNRFDYSFDDEAEDYLELRRQQEDDFYENQNQTYELDWYYDEYCRPPR